MKPFLLLICFLMPILGCFHSSDVHQSPSLALFDKSHSLHCKKWEWMDLGAGIRNVTYFAKENLFLIEGVDRNGQKIVYITNMEGFLKKEEDPVSFSLEPSQFPLGIIALDSSNLLIAIRTIQKLEETILFISPDGQKVSEVRAGESSVENLESIAKTILVSTYKNGEYKVLSIDPERKFETRAMINGLKAEDFKFYSMNKEQVYISGKKSGTSFIESIKLSNPPKRYRYQLNSLDEWAPFLTEKHEFIVASGNDSSGASLLNLLVRDKSKDAGHQLFHISAENRYIANLSWLGGSAPISKPNFIFLTWQNDEKAIEQWQWDGQKFSSLGYWGKLPHNSGIVLYISNKNDKYVLARENDLHRSKYSLCSMK